MEIEKLKALLTRSQGTNESVDSDDEIPQAKKAKIASLAALAKDAMQAGKKFTVCNSLWTDPGAIRHLALLRNKESEDLGLTESDDDEGQIKEQAQMIYQSLPTHLRTYVKEAWFRTRVSYLFNVTPVTT